MQVNVETMFLDRQAPHSRHAARGGGAIVNVSRSPLCARAASRLHGLEGAVIALTRAMAVDHGREGIRVNCVPPVPSTRDGLCRRHDGGRARAATHGAALQREGTGWASARRALPPVGLRVYNRPALVVEAAQRSRRRSATRASAMQPSIDYTHEMPGDCRVERAGLHGGLPRGGRQLRVSGTDRRYAATMRAFVCGSLVAAVVRRMKFRPADLSSAHLGAQPVVQAQRVDHRLDRARTGLEDGPSR